MEEPFKEDSTHPANQASAFPQSEEALDGVDQVASDDSGSLGERAGVPPHDAYFSEMMSTPDVMRSFFAHFLPEQLRGKLDLNQLQQVDTKLVSPQLSRRYADKLFRGRTKEGDDYFIYLLVEHQSTPDDSILRRILEYRDLIWDKYGEKGQDKPYPPVIPLLFYTGDRPFRGARHIRELIQGPQWLVDLSLKMPLMVVDIQQLDLRSYIDETSLWSMLLAFLLARMEEDQMIERIRIELAPGQLEQLYLMRLVNYLMRSRPAGRDPAEFIRRLANHLPEREAAVTITYYDAMVKTSEARGEARGETRGEKRGKAEGDRNRLVSMVTKMKERGMPLTVIAECADLSLQELQSILAEN